MLYAVIKAQLIKYAQTFPYAKPQGAIQTALGILADIYSDAIFVERNPDAAKEPIASAVRTILTVRDHISRQWPRSGLGRGVRG